MNAADTRALLSAIERKVRLLEAALTTASGMLAALDQDEEPAPEMLATAFEDRQNIFTELQSVDAFLIPYRREWSEIAHEVAPDARAEIERLGARARRAARDLLVADQRILRCLVPARQRLTDVLGGIQRGQEAIRGYRPFRAGAAVRVHRDV